MIPVKQTKNYSLFENMKGNRQLASRVAKMVKSMKRKNMLKDFPILVTPPDKKTRKHQILDGQARFAAAKVLRLPVFYKVAEVVEGIRDVSAANTVQRPWVPGDYVASWAAQGLKHYIKLQEFANEFGLSYTTSAALLAGKEATGGAKLEDVRSGSFKIMDEEGGRKVGMFVLQMRRHVPFATDRSLVYAILYLMKIPEFDPNRMLKKLALYPSQFERCADYEQYLDQLEAIYNRKVKPDNIMFLAGPVKKLIAQEKSAYLKQYKNLRQFKSEK